ncbi:MAG: nucleotidyltransferase family protein [Longimicrobiales bacterium]
MKAIGPLVAEALSGSWRTAPPAPALTPEEWERVAPALLRTGAGGLGWWRLRGSPCAASSPGPELRNAYRIHTVDGRHQELRLARALRLFADAGIEPILAKGWAVARLYPQVGLRPYGDLDLHVAPEAHRTALALLPECEREGLLVDLHRGVPHVGRPWGDILGRSGYVGLGETRVRVIGPEDHLALLCAHLLSHGAWRPLWLCDVGLFVESLPPGFDWAYLRRLPSREAEQVRLVVLLAHRLLGARLDATPWSANDPIPGWLPTATLRAWGRGGHYLLTTPIALTEARPGAFLESIRVRWPNAIEATVRWRAPYNAFPRLPFQIVDATVRAAQALAGAPRWIARRMRA